MISHWTPRVLSKVWRQRNSGFGQSAFAERMSYLANFKAIASNDQFVK